jgi:peroxiredoxin Q/BCP
MRRLAVLALLAGCMVLVAHLDAAAQDAPTFLSVGQMAPDFEVVGATRYGVLSEPLSLSDFRGETVVLAFFFKARTGG